MVSAQFLTMCCFSQLANIWVPTLHKVLNKVVSTINFVQSSTLSFCSFYISIHSLFLNILTSKNKYDLWCLLGFVKCTARTYMTVCDWDCPLLACNLVGMYQHFRGSCFLHLYSTCIMFLHRSQKQFQLTLVPIYQTTWRHTSEHYNFNIHNCKNLESHTACDK